MAVDQIRRLYESMPGKLGRARRRFGPALEKQGGDHDLFEQPDRVSIDDPAALRRGRPVEVLIGQPAGRTITIHGNHITTDSHISWFEAGVRPERAEPRLGESQWQAR